MKKLLLLLIPLIAIILVGCSKLNGTVSDSTHQAVPTPNQLFTNVKSPGDTPTGGETGSSAAPTIASIFSEYKTSTSIPIASFTPEIIRPKPATQDPSETPEPTENFSSATLAATLKPTSVVDPFSELVVYDDQLSLDWTLQPLVGMDVNFSDDMHVHHGNKAIAITPLQDFRSFSLTVRSTAKQNYSRDHVVGLSFWLNSGGQPLSLSDLAVTVLGSNDYPFWVPGDTSVFKDAQIKFSETRLYDLDINHTIPANTWVEVIVYPDKLTFDPTYRYITGFYIKNNEGFLRTYYVDDISLLILKNDPRTKSSTSIPTDSVQDVSLATSTPTPTPSVPPKASPTLSTP